MAQSEHEAGVATGLSARDLSAGYGSRPVFAEISLSLRLGELTALVGPNGSGKTTLLHSLCGIHTEGSGTVFLGEKKISSLSRRQIARRVSLVPQFTDVGFEITVSDAVSLGRYPWLGPMAPLTALDHDQIEAAMISMNLLSLRKRSLRTLSGGERQRVHLARALAQSTPVLLLDEPVASLDLKYQQETYERLGSLARDEGKAILVADHHLNLVGATCDRILVLHQEKIVGDGTPGEIITEEMIRDVFGARMSVRGDEKGRPQCLWAF